MGELVAKVVLTGGPCAGKTSALSRIEEDLNEKGYRVFIVGESATEIIKGGIRPFGNLPIDNVIFQSLILDYQLNKERIYEEAVKSLDDNVKCVIIYDRGALDNKAYIDYDKFKKILKQKNYTEPDLLENYDMVIHLVTAADGAEGAYTLANNATRTETIEQARELDKKTMNAWVGHNNLKIIGNESDFSTKLNNVVDCIHNLIGIPISTRKQLKYLIDLDKSDLSYINSVSCSKIRIEQYYLENDKRYETRLRKRTYEGTDTYYLALQIKEPNGNIKVLSNKKITEKDFYKLLAEASDPKCVIKDRYFFIKHKQYLRLDIFDSGEAILEVEPTVKDQEIKLPSKLKIIKEVTNDPSFQNPNLATKKKETIKIIA